METSARKDLRELYRTRMTGLIAPLERQRMRVLHRILIAGAMVVVAAVVVLALFSGYEKVGDLVSLTIGGGFVVGGLWVHGPLQELRRDFKKGIIAPIVELVAPGLRYIAAGSIPQSVFDQCGIYKHRIDRYKGDDLVRGKAGDTEFEFSEVHAEYKTRSKNRTHWHTIFKGLLFSADFNKHFRGRTYVLTDVAEKTLGWLGKSLQAWAASGDRGELVHLEDAEFEREFAVYSNDQVEARYVLSPSLMRRMLDFRRRTRKKVQFSFADTRVFVAIPFGEDLFEPRIFRRVVDFRSVEAYFEILRLAIGIVEDLNLNQRIWTKS